MKKTKRIQSLIMAVVMLLSTVVFAASDIKVAEAASTLTVKLYYFREDNAYSAWDVWSWAPNADGAAYTFDTTEEIDGKTYGVATINVAVGTSKIGYIVRTAGEWTEKDVDADQFISTIDYAGGTLKYYITSKVAGGTIDDTETKKGCVITNLELAKDDNGKYTKINVTFNVNPASLAEDPITDVEAVLDVKDSNGNKVDIAAVSPMEEGSVNTTILLDKEIDIKQATMNGVKYTVNFNDADYPVPLPDYYSSEDFEKEYTYKGTDLGANWTKDSTVFKVWAPTAASVSVKLYNKGEAVKDSKGNLVEDNESLIKEVPMVLGENGVWSATESGDLNKTYYTYKVTFNDGTSNETCDPYAKAVGVNGDRAMVIDMDSTDPEGWDKDVNPYFGKNINYTDCSIWEIQVRDFSYDAESGVSDANRGKYLAFTEKGTKNSTGKSTCLDYLEQLGITHVQINPAYDYATVDETKLDKDQYNWGYDPKNYNVPEGSYSSDPYNGEVRVKEFKQMVQSLHNAGIGVVMDVVYNHTYSTNFCFNQIVPGYCYRGTNGSGCGNDIASERAMMSEFIIQSVLYWHDEYHIDGFRFDLVGLIDIDTINAITEKLHEEDPSIILYGEGWTIPSTIPTKDGVKLATQGNSSDTPGFAYFNDFLRDALKGSVFTATDKGYVNGAVGKSSDIAACSAAQASWTGLESDPLQMIQYSSCHDNLTLWDKIASSNGTDSFDSRVKQNNLAAAITFTSQGIPFILAGEEMLRTKVKADGTFDSNSYASPSAENSIKWGDLSIEKYAAVNDYYKGLMAFRNAHPSLRMASEADVNRCLKNVNTSYVNEYATSESGDKTLAVGGVVENVISGYEGEDAIVVIYNPNGKAVNIELPEGVWNVYVEGDKAGNEVLGTVAGTVSVDACSATVLVEGEATDISKDVTVSKISNKTYTGKAIKPSVTVKYNSKKLKKDTDYTLSYSSNKNAGTAKVKITFKGLYKGTVTKTFKIAQAAQSIKVKTSISKKKSDKAFKLGARLKKGNGKLSYKSGNTKIAKVDAKGKVTLTGKKGTVKITVTAAATTNFKKAAKTVTIKVK